MRRWGRNISWVLRRVMTFIGTILLIMLAARLLDQTGWEPGGEKMGKLLEEQGEALIGYVWEKQYVPDGGRDRSGGSRKDDGWLPQLLKGFFPALGLGITNQAEKSAGKDEDPAYEAYVENGKFYEEHQYLKKYGGEETGELPGKTAPEEVKLTEGDSTAEGSGNTDSGSEEGAADGTKESPEANTEESGKDTGAQTASMAGNMDQLTCAVSNTLPVIGNTYRLEQLADYDYMMKHFFIVHTTATAGRDLMNAQTFLNKDFTLETGSENPQILIYHSHSQEEYADYSQNNPGATVVGMGEYLTKLLTEKGYHVIHDTSVYDLKNGKLDRNKAYTYALEGITGILQENPSIEVVLDLHRDGVDSSLHLVSEVNGKATAPIMFFNGVSQTPEGPIEYLPNPYREDNLAFSFQMQLDAAAYYPGLTRKIYIKGLRYNMHLRPRSALVEVGAQTNTYEEALNAMEPLAELLDMVLRGN